MNLFTHQTTVNTSLLLVILQVCQDMASKTLISISSSKDLLQGGTKLLLTYFVFIGVRCLSVCLCMSVCLLAYYEKETAPRMFDFHEIFRVGGT